MQFDSGKPLGMGLDTNPLWGADCMEGGYAVVVARLNEAENGEPGVAQKSGLVNAGDFVVAVNGASTVNLGYDEVIIRTTIERDKLASNSCHERTIHTNSL